MRKVFLFILGWVISFSAIAQQVKQVQLVSSQLLKGFGESGVMRVIKPVFSHEGSTLSADSANFNQAKNTFEAFGHVVITQSNGTSVFADLLNYNGNTRIALLTNNVRLVDQDAILTTDIMTYNMATRVGTYTGGGKIVNAQNELTSKNGFYFANSRDAYFRHDVVVNTPQALIKSDTLKYNSGTKIAYFYGPTNITGKQDKSNLYTENGEYNTLTDQARFGKKNLYTDGSRSLKGDSLFYDKNAGYGRAVKNITFIDTAEKILLKGNLGIYRRADSSTLVTRNAYVVLTTKDSASASVDSIWMTADTLFTKVIAKKDLQPIKKEELKDDEEVEDAPSKPADEPIEEPEKPSPSTAQAKNNKNGRKKLGAEKAEKKETKDAVAAPPPTDSMAVAKDTVQKKSAARDTLMAGNAKKDSVIITTADTVKTRIVQAFHQVKIFKSDLQARADSAFYSYADSTIRCFASPMIWTQGSQLSADTLYIQLKNQQLDNMLLQNSGLIVNTEDSVKYNQVKGKVLTGFFKNNKLDRMYVDGNAESVYYTREDSVVSGMNRSVSSRMKVLFKDNQLQDVIFIRKPEMTYYPIKKAPKDLEILDGFKWKPKERPKSKEEIIPTTEKKPEKAPVKPELPQKGKATLKPSIKKKR